MSKHSDQVHAAEEKAEAKAEAKAEKAEAKAAAADAKEAEKKAAVAHASREVLLPLRKLDDGRTIYRLETVEFYEQSGKYAEFITVTPGRGPQGPKQEPPPPPTPVA